MIASDGKRYAKWCKPPKDRSTLEFADLAAFAATTLGMPLQEALEHEPHVLCEALIRRHPELESKFLPRNYDTPWRDPHRRRGTATNMSHVIRALDTIVARDIIKAEDIAGLARDEKLQKWPEPNYVSEIKKREEKYKSQGALRLNLPEHVQTAIRKRKRVEEDNAHLRELMAAWNDFAASAVRPPRLSIKPQSMRDVITQLLKECEAETPVLKESISGMDLQSLKTLRKLSGKCFTLEELFKVVKDAQEKNKVARDPLTRQVWSKQVQDEIIKQYKLLVDSKAIIKPPVVPFDEKEVQLIMQPIQVTVPGGAHGVPVSRPFWRLAIAIPSLNHQIELGYVPEYDNPQDVSHSTSVLLSSLRKLWDKRRLLITHSPNEDITCCTVPLRKPVQYWIRPDGSLNGDRLKDLIQEIQDHL